MFTSSITPPRRGSLELRRVSYGNIFLQSPNQKIFFHSPATSVTTQKVFYSPLKYDFNSLLDSPSTSTTEIYQGTLLTPFKSTTLTQEGTPALQLTTLIASEPPAIEYKHFESKISSATHLDTHVITPAPNVGVRPIPRESTCHACRHKAVVYPCHNLTPPTQTCGVNRCCLVFCYKCIEFMVQKSAHVQLPSIIINGNWDKYLNNINTGEWCCPRCHGFCTCTICNKFNARLIAGEVKRKRPYRTRKEPNDYWKIDPTVYTNEDLMKMVGEPKWMPNKRSNNHESECLADETGAERCMNENGYCSKYSV